MNIINKFIFNLYIRRSEVKYLYKYRSFCSRELSGVFEKQKVYIPSPLSFNDPFDCMPIIHLGKNKQKIQNFKTSIILHKEPNATQSRIDEILSKPNVISVTQEDTRYICQQTMAETGIYCLSEVNDDILMWAHYTNSHEGICLEFDAQNSTSIFYQAWCVNYRRKYPKVNMLRIDKLDNFYKIVLTKSLNWKYEKERRIIMTKQEKGPGEYNFPPEALVGVILGERISSQNKKLVYRWISNYPTKINIYKARLNPHKYKLDIMPNRVEPTQGFR